MSNFRIPFLPTFRGPLTLAARAKRGDDSGARPASRPLALRGGHSRLLPVRDAPRRRLRGLAACGQPMWRSTGDPSRLNRVGLGFYHSAAYPDTRFREQTSEVQRGLGPVMSYGVNPTRRFEVTDGIGNLDQITPDDEVGISLLRPRAGWPEATGASAAPSSRMTKPRPASRRCWRPGPRTGNRPGSG